MRLLAGATLIMTYALIILGGWVRANNAGLSCPDWPTCYGQWVLTPADFAALGDVGYSYYQMKLEWAHRFMAAFIVGPLILVIAALAWRNRADDRTGWHIAMALLLVLAIQGSIGGLTVLDSNSPWSVALHLGTALVLFSMMMLVFVRAGSVPSTPVLQGYAWLATTVWVLAIATMASAAMTAKSGASLACYEWPSCDGSYLPSLDEPQVFIHFVHRKLAAATGIGAVFLLAGAWFIQSRVCLRHAGLATILIACQIGLGALVIVLEMPQWSQVAHQALGVFFFAVLAKTMWHSWTANSHIVEAGSHAGLSRAR